MVAPEFKYQVMNVNPMAVQHQSFLNLVGSRNQRGRSQTSRLDVLERGLECPLRVGVLGVEDSDGRTFLLISRQHLWRGIHEWLNSGNPYARNWCSAGNRSNGGGADGRTGWLIHVAFCQLLTSIRTNDLGFVYWRLLRSGIPPLLLLVVLVLGKVVQHRHQQWIVPANVKCCRPLLG